MRLKKASMDAELADRLDRFGKEQGGRVACAVIVTDDEIRFAFPGRMSSRTATAIEELILDALMCEYPQRYADRPKSR